MMESCRTRRVSWVTRVWQALLSAPEQREEIHKLRANLIKLSYALQNTREELAYLRGERKKERQRKQRTAGSIIMYHCTAFFQHSAILCFLVTVVLQLSSLLISLWLPELFLDESDWVVEKSSYQHITWFDFVKHGDIFNLMFWPKHSELQT